MSDETKAARGSDGREAQRLSTPTDCLIGAMEEAEHFDVVLVIAQRRDGMLQTMSSASFPTQRLGMLQLAHLMILESLKQ